MAKVFSLTWRGLAKVQWEGALLCRMAANGRVNDGNFSFFSGTAR
ncbi:hypothetical protein [Neolewinella persica]|nr:hypothetical protein [Neolewinella persica]